MQISFKDNNFFLRNKKSEITIGEKLSVNSLPIEGPGEYEVQGVAIFGLPAGGFVMKDDEFGFGWLVNRQTELSEKTLEDLPDVEILFISLSENLERDLKNIQIIDPKIIIPLGDKEQIEKFSAKEGNVENVGSSCKLTRNDLPLEEQKIIIFA